MQIPLQVLLDLKRTLPHQWSIYYPYKLLYNAPLFLDNTHIVCNPLGSW